MFSCIRIRSTARSLCAISLPMVVMWSLSAGGLAAQRGATVTGSVVASSGAALAEARVVAEPGGRGVLTDNHGAFQLTDLPAGPVTIRASLLGYAPAEQTIVLAAGSQTSVRLVLEEQALRLDGLVVSVNREAQRKLETAATVGVVTAEQIQATGAAHPGEVMREVPGVWANVTSGEGHQMAIRQPLTTNPVYLYLEDGIPTRSTGFFNHNALYEINLPQANRIEVTKGPATALYGSDAIGGIINVSTRPPSVGSDLEATAEAGSFGWQRLLLSASNTFGADGFRADLNLTRTGGWRDATGYSRESGTVRWDRELSGTSSLRTVATFSHIDQGTAGSSVVNADDYQHDPTLNYTPISFRKVNAFRLSTEYSKRTESTLYTLTPFVRSNSMDLLPNWSLTYDPTVYTTGNQSLGVLAKVRRDLEPMRARVIGGVDVDYSPGYRHESLVDPTREGKIFTSYTLAGKVYDYDVTYHGVSPYVQAEASPVDRMRVTAGLRYDILGFDYDTKLEPVQTGRYRRPADTDVGYRHLSPKLGATYELNDELNFFADYGHGFRAPSEGQLFRQGQAVNTVGLIPVKVDSYEAGARGLLFGRVSYDLSLYDMRKSDDILSYTNPDGTTETVNAGRTLHRGVELGVGAELAPGLRADVAYSRARHTYEEWSPKPGVDLGGKEMEIAPRTLANAGLTYTPGFYDGSRFGIEWTRVGSYWMDPQNTHRYPGHDLWSLRTSVPVMEHVGIFARVTNLTDRRFAESAAYTVARGAEYAPGMPRTIYLGIERN
jgi:outer membrane receptor protein involved in Fe transport